MSDKHKLAITEQDDRYHIGWYSKEDGFGLYLGDMYDSDEDLKDQIDDYNNCLCERDVLVAEIVGRELFPDRTHQRYRLCWSTRKEASEVLREIKRRILLDTKQWKDAQKSRPWPEWALTAANNGWTPPKNWNP